MVNVETISIIIFLIIVGLLAIFLGSKKLRKRGPDYYTFFIMGIIWMPVGIAVGNMGLWSLGLIFTILGLIHRKKWNNRKEAYDKMTKSEKSFQKILIAILTLIFLAGFVVYFLSRSGLV